MKKLLAVMLAIVLVSSIVLSMPVPASAESLYIRKIVSVVYDDSGSMSKNGSMNWAYGNYALQSLCGLLNSDDQLYITYMSAAEENPDLDPPKVNLGASQVQASVDAIREHKDHKNTPYHSIDVAFNKLKSVEDSNVNTQYWLVVITDGTFQTGDGNATEGDMTEKLNGYVNTQMPNGSKPQISYLAIGAGVPKPAENEKAGLYVYSSAGAEDIVNTMSKIADKISGRSRLQASDIVKKDSRTVEIKSSVSLLNIAVLAQKTSAKIVSVTGSGQTLSIEKSASIRYPEVSGWTTDKTLLGGTFLVNNGDKNIPAGTYQIRFDGDIDLDNVVIMFEPALELRMSLKVNGKEISDFSQLHSVYEDDTLEVSCKLYEIGTDNEISPSLLPPDTTYKLTIAENGQDKQVCDTTEMKLPAYALHNTKTEISATVYIKGFNPIVLTTGEFTPMEAIVYTIDATMPENYSMTMAQLKENTQKIYFTIYADGVAVDKATAESLPFAVNTKLPGKVEYESDGRVSFMPMYQDPVTAIPTGDVEVTGALGTLASKTVTVYIKPPEYTVEAVEGERDPIIRTELDENTTGVQFEIFVDGEKLDKAAVEAADIQYSMNGDYARLLDLQVSVADDGTVTVVPTYGWGWFAAYAVPTGNLEITACTNGASAADTLEISKDALYEWIYNVLIPLLVFLFILGHILKPRFQYGWKIHYNEGSSKNFIVTGSKSGWNTSNLFTLMMLVPFIADRKMINGVRFCAGRSQVIRVKAGQLPEYSGTLSSGISEMSALRFSKQDVSRFEEGEKVRAMVASEALVTSADPNYSSCQVYLYSAT